MRANKQLFEDRKMLMASNKVLQAFVKRYDMSYFNMLYNSHIETADVYRPVLKSRYGVSTSEQIYNTQRLLSYMIEPSNDVSRTNCNNRLRYYLSTLLMSRYPGVSSSKTLNIYTDILVERKWWNSNINLYELFEAICLTKNRKHREVHKILTTIMLGKMDGLESFLTTISILLDIYMNQIDMNTKVVIVYIMFAYIENSMQYIKEVKRNMVDFLIEHCSMYIDIVTYNSRMRLPKYLKTMIADRLRHIEELIRGI